MENVTVAEAKERLEDLIEAAARGEEVRIIDTRLGCVRIAISTIGPGTTHSPRRLGLLAGIVPPPPDDFFDPLSDEELEQWSGAD